MFEKLKNLFRGQRQGPSLPELRPLDALWAIMLNEHATLVLPGDDQTKACVPLFSSPFLANDYLRYFKLEGTVAAVKRDKWADAMRMWTEGGGADRWCLDRCPRCEAVVTIPLDTLREADKVQLVYGINWNLRMSRGRTLFQNAMSKLGDDPAAAIQSLEEIRDHVDCGIPYLHQLIALVAGTINDEDRKAAAVERLNEFGPAFENKSEFSPQNLAEASVALAAIFGILK